LGDDYSVLHPSLLRAIRQVVQMCDEAGRELSVCGEAAGDPETACLLLGLGIRRMSVSPGRAARVRLRIRQAQMSQLAKLAQRALEADGVATVKALLQRFSPDAFPGASSGCSRSASGCSAWASFRARS
jgi:phosphoenolpyruvate-protein kinase (PTS system EI component)